MTSDNLGNSAAKRADSDVKPNALHGAKKTDVAHKPLFYNTKMNNHNHNSKNKSKVCVV